MKQWRLLGSADCSHLSTETDRRTAEAEWNMEFDAGLLSEMIANRIPPTLRLYQWKQPAMTVGRFQNIERTVNLEFCEGQNLPIVRRMTGGRGILHGTDLTVTLAAPISCLLPHGDETKGVGQIYRAMSGIFLKAFAKCGISAQQGRETDNRSTAGNCFALHSPADIVTQNGMDKILGAALHRSGDFVLMQASVPRSGDEALLASVFAGANAFRVLPADFSLERLEVAIVHQFAENFAISFLISEQIDRK